MIDIDNRLHDAISKHRNNWTDITADMDKHGYKKTPNAWRKRAKRKDITGENTKTTISYHDGVIESERTIKLTPQELQNTRSVLLAHEYDPSDWEIVHARHSQWEQRSKDNTETLYASKITVRPKRTIDFDDISKMFETLEPKHAPFDANEYGKTGGKILELTLADLHMNKLAWAGSTGESYDLSIACKRVRAVMASIMERIGEERYSYIIVPLGNDLFNSEGTTGMTHGGTPQDEDSRGHKVFDKTLELFIEIIEALRKHGKVIAPLIQGNHDPDTSMMFAFAIKCWFKDCTGVVVDTLPMKRKYFEFGKVMLALGHFDADTRELPNVVPGEAPEMWGRTTYREAHGAHKHQEEVKSLGKIKFRRAPTITGRDEWHTQQGYLYQQEHISYVWDTERGLTESWHHVV